MSRDAVTIRRLSLTLPASMKGTAEHDARRIAEALGQKLYENGGQTASIHIEGHGQASAQLATRAAMALPKGGRNGG